MAVRDTYKIPGTEALRSQKSGDLRLPAQWTKTPTDKNLISKLLFIDN